MKNQRSGNIFIPISIVVAALVIGLSLFFGLKESKKPAVLSDQPSASPAQQLRKAQASIDDDPVMGNKETAKVAIVEFSDYECPFCKRFRDQTLGQIKKEYIDTGKAILVYRDLPLDIHNPAAEREAMAAECARAQGGDEIYYQYHDEIFNATSGNGQGITVDELGKIAEDLGLNGSELEKCVDNEQFKDEVSKDMADAAKVGINGTPGFVVGKLDKEGNVDGVVIGGAQPYPVFQTVIEQYLE